MLKNQSFKDKLQDMMITVTTIFIILNRKEEAQFIIERCILICEKYGYDITRGTLTLMLASLYLNDRSKTYEDVNEKAHEALSIFIQIDNIEGRAETNFLFGMISKKKILRKHNSEGLKLKEKSKSDMFTKKMLEHEPLMQKGKSITVQIASKDDKTYLDVAKDLFQRMSNIYGVSRVSLAIAIRLMEQDVDINDEA